LRIFFAASALRFFEIRLGFLQNRAFLQQKIFCNPLLLI